ncbi:FGGY family carbohydrate kinase [Nocardioides sp. cx-173]|uniref:FGGY family carbohydrate kinase n=1 Tax=Nocardioides sp. cx-173 TaxID=2898796 RepID=UPI001E3DD0D4|nr:FGGY family carbohydrate kinase [Nocardioides sp. cx-173]MCD4524624.1 xylulose kinase [Nocardioides sp. cx-173]UGB42894.1 xylulose kinase [Nocardioides sp. cx-173]
MTLVLGVDSSTQSTKAVLVDAADGTVVAERSAPHPDGTEVDPRAWLAAYDDATAGLVERAEALAVGGQQHGMVALGKDGQPVRDALLWNDTRSADAARTLVGEMGGPDACAAAVGSVLVASFTASKLRWLRDHEPEAAAAVREVLLPHDYVSRHAAAPGTPAFTDRGDASGTGYFDATTGAWRRDLAAAALGHEVGLPRVAADGAAAAETAAGQKLGPGTGDNMAAALGLGLGPGDVLVSIGTSGVASAVSATPVADGTGTVTGFADAAGGYLPMVTTMNAARILSLQARWLGVDLDALADLALASEPGARGVTLLPYYGGERTPNRPTAVGTWTGLSDATTREDLARAAFEALLCSLADAVDHLAAATGVQPARVLLVGGATRSPAVRALAPAILGRPVTLPPAGEYVARGAARQAAWALAGTSAPPSWALADTVELEAESTPHVRDTYARLRDRTGTWS